MPLPCNRLCLRGNGAGSTWQVPRGRQVGGASAVRQRVMVFAVEGRGMWRYAQAGGPKWRCRSGPAG